MNNLLFAVLLLALALLGVVMRKTYFYIPLHELKRKAERGDKQAIQLYKAAAYGNSLKAMLWLFIGLTTAGSLVLLARELPVWFSLLIVGPLLWVTFSLIPASRLTNLGLKLTSTVTPSVAWILNYLHPLIGRSTDSVRSHYVAASHTRIFEKEDLIDLIERQQSQVDSRISPEELEIVKGALSFGERKVAEAVVPRKQIKTVLAEDNIGPVLIDEVHKSGQDFVLVREKSKGPIIGTLEFGKLSIRSTGKVKDIMDDTVYYVHENDSLSEALHAFFVTNHSMFIVVNSFEEFVGIVTVEHILYKLLGHVPGDNFDQYSDLEAVAARHDKKQKPKEPEADKSPDSVKTDDKMVE